MFCSPKSPLIGANINPAHARGITWSDKGCLWDYTITFKGAQPMKGSIRAETKAAALKLLKNRHLAHEETGATQVTVHGKSKGVR